MGNNCLTVTGFFLGGENIVELDRGDGCTVLRMYNTTEFFMLK